MSELQNAMDFFKSALSTISYLPSSRIHVRNRVGGAKKRGLKLLSMRGLQKPQCYSETVCTASKRHCSLISLTETSLLLYSTHSSSTQKKSVPVKRNVLYFMGRALPCGFKNSFCQILQWREKNHPTISAREETCRMWQTRWNKQWPFHQTSEAALVLLLSSVCQEQVQRGCRDFTSGCITIVHKRQPPFFPGF